MLAHRQRLPKTLHWVHALWHPSDSGPIVLAPTTFAPVGIGDTLRDALDPLVRS